MSEENSGVERATDNAGRGYHLAWHPLRGRSGGIAGFVLLVDWEHEHR